MDKGVDPLTMPLPDQRRWLAGLKVKCECVCAPRFVKHMCPECTGSGCWGTGEVPQIAGLADLCERLDYWEYANYERPKSLSGDTPPMLASLNAPLYTAAFTVACLERLPHPSIDRGVSGDWKVSVFIEAISNRRSAIGNDLHTAVVRAAVAVAVELTTTESAD